MPGRATISRIAAPGMMPCSSSKPHYFSRRKSDIDVIIGSEATVEHSQQELNEQWWILKGLTTSDYAEARIIADSDLVRDWNSTYLCLLIVS